MKRIFNYTLLIVQIVFIAIIVYQFENIDKYGEKIILETKVEYIYDSDLIQNSDIYVDYLINKINEEQWEIDEEINFNRPVYVTLMKNEYNIHEVRMVTKKKPKNRDLNDVIIKANYNYEDSTGYNYVSYGFEYLEDTGSFGNLKEGDDLIVTVLLGKWGQQKITEIERQ